jgi:hypothetical protein
MGSDLPKRGSARDGAYQSPRVRITSEKSADLRVGIREIVKILGRQVLVGRERHLPKGPRGCKVRSRSVIVLGAKGASDAIGAIEQQCPIHEVPGLARCIAVYVKHPLIAD